MRGWPQFNSLPKDDLLWMITWLGPLYRDQNAPSQYAVLCHLTTLYPSKRRSPRQVNYGAFPRPDQFSSHRVRSIALSSGDLAALCVGMIFRNGKLVTPRKTLTPAEHFRADFGAQKSLKLSELPLLDQKTALMAGDWATMAASGCVALPDDQGRMLLIPVLEVIRWSYGASSRLLQAVLSGEIGAVIEQVQASGTLEGRDYFMTVPGEFPETDAPLLARLALDEQAGKQARQVHLQIIAGKDRQAYHFPRAIFPYARPPEGQPFRAFAAQGRWLDPQHYLVHRVLYVSDSPPFGAVYLPPQVELDGPPQDTDAAQTRHARARRGNVRKAQLYSNQEPRAARTATRLPALPAMLSDFTAVLRLPPSKEQSGARLLPRTPVAGTSFSTGLGSDRASALKRAVLAHDRREDETPILTDYFVQLRAAVGRLSLTGFTVSELLVNNPGGQEGRFEHWRRENGQRIGCLVIEVQNGATFFYLLDKELVHEPYGPLILAHRTGFPHASAAEVNVLMNTRVHQRTWPKSAMGWTLTHIRHQYANAETYARGLQKHMDTAQASP
ncbi:hypothetical protein [Deinococcus arenicola]|uniref:Uncharacterized protein n=1 Tax=Deinococcus arenicola TaxID=2994950 RepID=A0ABU4DP05_9DEIO|nr:hypothetical protein [Deinococcus sp. ZS9-10]MDV6374170.1 hypothetical protein [Deinococcus sp. ZS9-10]